MWKKFKAFLREVPLEMKKVTWPRKDEISESTVIVFISVVFLAIVLGFSDLILGKSVGFILSNQPVVDGVEFTSRAVSYDAADEVYEVEAGKVIDVFCTASDRDQPNADSLNYKWKVDGGKILSGNKKKTIKWQAPEELGEYTVSVRVRDNSYKMDSQVLKIKVVPVKEEAEDAPEEASVMEAIE